MNVRTLGAAVALATAIGTLPLAAQDIRGRVVDDRTRQGIRAAAVSLLDAEGRVLADAATDEGGFFRLRAPSEGLFTLVVVQPGYGEHRADVRAAGAERVIPAVVLKTQAVELDPLEVEARRAREREGAQPAGFQRTSHIIAGERLARMEGQGGNLMRAVKGMGSLRTREYMEPGGRSRTCVESLRAAPTGLQIGGTMMGGNPSGQAPCQWVAIVVDGLIVGGDPERTFREVQFLGDYESVEYMPPAEAGRLYGMDASSSGALVLWTRGRGPHVSDARNR